MKHSGVGLSAAMGVIWLALASAVSAQSVAIVGGVPAVEDFDSLASAGSSSMLPEGWFLSENGSTVNITYEANDGSSNSGNTYSYGSAGSSERALGSLQSNSLVPLIGARLVNSTGGTLSEIAVQYTGEQWRLGATGRVDRLDFQYSLDATSLTTGKWIDVNGLDLVAPVSAGSLGALNGNAPANRVAVSGTISGLTLAADATIWVRWSDFNPSGIDDGLAIDDISFGVPGDFLPIVVSTVPADAAIDVAVDTAVSVRFSESISIADAGGISLDCGVGTPGISLGVSGNTLNMTPAGDLPWGAACTVAIAANAINDLDGTPDPLDAPFDFSFATLVDNPPTLVSSTPANGAIDFPANANLQLQFSEPVNLAGNWFDIACSSSGARGPADVTLSGGPAAYTLNPDTDFTQGENCVLTLDAAQITDLDGMADPLDGPNSIAFTPAAPVANIPPSVLSTTPMDGDNSFPSAGDLVVLFSEPVTVSPGAFTLVCDASTGIVLSHDSSGTSFTIDTGTALVAGDACVFTIVASLVQDSEAANPAADVVVQFTVSSSSVGKYYQQVNTSSPEQLRCSLHDRIKDHTEYPYGWVQLEMADEDPLNSGRILDIYRNCSFEKVTNRDGNTSGSNATCGSVGGLRYNREHVWPRSLGFNNTGLAAHNDLHMLHLSEKDFNAHRGNKPYDYCPQSGGCLEDRTIAYAGQGGGNGTYPGLSNWYTSTDGSNGSYEVWSKLRGNVARAIFYMAIRYEGGDNLPDLELTDDRDLIVITPTSAAKAYMGIRTTLLEWHLQDPVDARELERNEVIYGFQGNRNPFVDHPEWATEALFTSIQPPTCILNSGGNSAPVANDDAYVAFENVVLNVLAAEGVLANDTDADNDALTAQLIANAINGSVVLNADGSFTYSPTPATCGPDSFTYRASDSQASSAAAVVSLNVTCDFDPDAIFADGFEN